MARHVLLVSDSCFAGDFFRDAGGVTEHEITDAYVAGAYAKTSRQALTSGGLEIVSDDGFRGHSVFAHFLLKELNESPSPWLVPSDLHSRIKGGVAQNASQTPMLGYLAGAGGEEGGEFVLFRDDIESMLEERSAALEELRAKEAVSREERGKELKEQEEKQKQLNALDAEIRALEKNLESGGKEGTLDELLSLVEEKERKARELEELRQRQEREERERQKEIKRLKQEAEQKRREDFEADWEKYQKITASPLASSGIKDKAWQALVGKWEIENADARTDVKPEWDGDVFSLPCPDPPPQSSEPLEPPRTSEIRGVARGLIWLLCATFGTFILSSLFLGNNWSFMGNSGEGKEFSGFLLGVVFSITAAIVLHRRRGSVLTGAELFLYWLASAPALALGLAMLFSIMNWSFLGELSEGPIFSGFLIGGALSIVIAVVLVWLRGSALTGVHLALFWLGSTTVLFLVLGNLFQGIHWSFLGENVDGPVFSGLLIGGALSIITAVILVGLRSSTLVVSELAIYWLGSAPVLTLGLAILFDALHWSFLGNDIGAPSKSGLLLGGALSIVAAIMLFRRWRWAKNQTVARLSEPSSKSLLNGRMKRSLKIEELSMKANTKQTGMDKKPGKTVWKRIAKAVLWLLLITTIFSFFFRQYSIPSGNMMPTILVGDRVLVNSSSYGYQGCSMLIT